MASCMKCDKPLPAETKRVVCANCERQIKKQYASPSEQTTDTLPFQSSTLSAAPDVRLAEAAANERKKRLIISVGTGVSIVAVIGSLILFVVSENQAIQRETLKAKQNNEEAVQREAMLQKAPPPVSVPAPIVMAPPVKPPRGNNVDWNKVDNPSLNSPALESSQGSSGGSQQTGSQQPASAGSQSPYQVASAAASEAEQSTIEGVFSGGSSEEPQTQDIQATVDSSDALNRMVTAMDEMAQSQQDLEQLYDLRRRFNAIMDKAYGGSGIDPQLPATRSYLQAHPGLPQVP